MAVNSGWLEIGKIFLELELELQRERKAAAGESLATCPAAASKQPTREAQANGILPVTAELRQPQTEAHR